MKRKPDPTRSEAARKGWETRRRRERQAQRLKRSLAARKGAAKKASQSPRGQSSEVRRLRQRVAQLELELVERKEELRKERELNQKLRRNFKRKVEEDRKKIERLQYPPKVLTNEAIEADKEAANAAVADMIKRKVADGWEFYTALMDTWEQVRDLDEYYDIADVREAWADEGDSPSEE